MPDKPKTIGRHAHGVICTRDEAIKKGLKPFCQCWDCRERERKEKEGKDGV